MNKKVTLSYAQELSNSYPEVYKDYNTLLGGGHLQTWTETWWNIARATLWIVGAEIAGRIVAAVLAPVTLGASVVVINVATQIGRTRVLGGAITRIAGSRTVGATLKAGGATVAAARWLLELPDRVITIIVNKFDDVARRVLNMNARVRPSSGTGANINGQGAAVAAANCCVRQRG